MGQWRLTFASVEAATIISRAIDVALGYPRKGMNVGAGPHAPIPDEYYDGAHGWTATACAISDGSDGLWRVTLTDEARELGECCVMVDGAPVMIDTRFAIEVV